MGTAIVAIPAEDDYVWKLSSEKVPHLTLLFLGEQSDNPQIGEIADFLEHVAETVLHQFGLPVDRRGTLGPDAADVVFFEKNSHAIKTITQARDFLLDNATIRKAYDSTDQFPEWTPHLTMGYPETPANEDDRDWPGVRWVQFDRLALWVGDFTGPEYRLKREDDLCMSSDDAVEKVLAHHGVKGMKWGVRRDATTGVRPIARTLDQSRFGQRANKNAERHMAKQTAKAERKAWKKTASGTEMANAIFQKAAKDFGPTAKIVNNDPHYKGKDLNAPENRRLRRDYDTTMGVLFNQHLAQASVDLTLNAQGRAYIYQLDRNTGLMRGVEHRMVVHEDVPPMPEYKVEFNDLGQAIDFTLVTELAHIAKTVFSDKPWSDFPHSAYDLEQWHHACLIHDHEGAPTAKSQCKLHVREPDGTLNQNGVYAATAALAGARSGVDATDDQKAQAARSLLRFYAQMDKEPPESLTSLGHSDAVDDLVDDVLEHHGVKGMKWGVRRDTNPSSVQVTQPRPGKRVVATGGKRQPASEDARKAAASRQKARASTTDALSNVELKQLVERMNLEANYRRLSAPQQSAGKKFLSKMLINKQFREQTVSSVRQAPGVDRLEAAIAVGHTIRKTDLSGIGK